MFTGLIEAVCKVGEIRRSGASAGLVVDLGEIAAECALGDSVAVNGVCLTVSKIAVSRATFDVSPETLQKSTLGDLRTGDEVNIERAMRADSRFGGHIVQGHVDGFATVKNIEQQGDFYTLRFAADETILSQLIAKGSVAVDGISLTVADLDDSGFSVAVIPQTWQHTTLKNKNNGSKVNVEIDLIVKTVRRKLEQILPGDSGLSIEKLKEYGF